MEMQLIVAFEVTIVVSLSPVRIVLHFLRGCLGRPPRAPLCLCIAVHSPHAAVATLVRPAAATVERTIDSITPSLRSSICAESSITSGDCRTPTHTSAHRAIAERPAIRPFVSVDRQLALQETQQVAIFIALRKIVDGDQTRPLELKVIERRLLFRTATPPPVPPLNNLRPATSLLWSIRNAFKQSPVLVQGFNHQSQILAITTRTCRLFPSNDIERFVCLPYAT